MFQESAIPFLLLIIVIFILLGWVIYLHQKLTKLLAGGLASDLPETINSLKKSSDLHDSFKREVSTYLKEAELRILRSTQAVGLVRFNPFKEGGSGGQSFAAAFIDQKGNGLIISSIYARDRMGVYAKPLKAFTSSFELTEEEKASIEEAKQSLKNLI